jgi:hypothetical protein
MSQIDFFIRATIATTVVDSHLETILGHVIATNLFFVTYIDFCLSDCLQLSVNIIGVVSIVSPWCS